MRKGRTSRKPEASGTGSDEGRIYGIIAGKGGVGKTTVSVNLALAMHQLGKSVVAVDADINSSGMAIQLGFYQFPKGIQEALREGINAMDVIYTHESQLHFIPAMPSLPSLYSRPVLAGLRRLLDDLASHVFIDSAPGFEGNTLAAMRASDEVIIITTPDMPSVSDALKAAILSKKMGKSIAGIVVNRMTNNAEMTVKAIEGFCDTPVIASIPEDRNVAKSLRARKPLISHRPYSPASMEIKRLAAGLAGSPFNPSGLARLRSMVAGFL